MGSLIYQVTTGQLSIALFCLFVFILVIQFVFSNWIKNKIEKSIQHEYDRKLEDYKFLQLQKQKAEIVAKFFSKWIKFRGKETEILSKKELIDYYEELNLMSIEMVLWIKDENLLKDIMLRLQNHEKAKDSRLLIKEFRKLILDIKKEDFDYKNITLWPTDEIAQKINLFESK